MKKKFIFLMFFLFLSSFIFATPTSYEEQYNVNFNLESSLLQVEALRYEPYPVSPGEYFRLYVQVRCTGTSCKNVFFELGQNFPFSLDNSDDSYKKFDILNSEPVVLEYKVRVSDDAVKGENNLDFIYSINSGGKVTKKFSIQVIDVQTSFDAVIQSNSNGELSIALANIGQNDAKSAIVRIPEQEDISVSSTNGQMIGNLEQGDYTVVGFTVSGKAKNLIIQIDYTDSIGERRSYLLEIPFSNGFAQQISSENFSQMNRGEFRNSQTKSSGFSFWFYLFVSIILVIIIYFGYKYYKKNLILKKKSFSLDWMQKEKNKK